jgi:hypothetical protein
VLVHLFGKLSFTSGDLLRGLRLAWPDRYGDAGYEIMDVEALLRDLTDFLPTVLRRNAWEALLANSSQRGPAGVFKALQTWTKNANMSRLHKPTGSLDAQVDAYVVDGRSEHALTWRRYVQKPVRVHGVAAKDLGSGNVHSDFLRPANLDMYAPALFDLLDQAYEGRTGAA